MAFAIHQNEGAIDAEITQVEQVSAGLPKRCIPTAGEVVTHRRGQRRVAQQDVGDVDLAGAFNLICSQRNDGISHIEAVVARDTRARNDNLFDLFASIGTGDLRVGRRQHRKRRQTTNH
jgi:hypothetical protein